MLQEVTQIILPYKKGDTILLYDDIDQNSSEAAEAFIKINCKLDGWIMMAKMARAIA
ncbi:hypothetical protein [Candidatus Cardinium hertigii]|uniref:hypothetical protein n=1 Tax=Candidatus Cardinium hertigii TaxID=247481 RepID=UPI003D7EDCDE